MNDDSALLRAVIESPDDDAQRLVYADWLDENGDPERAEFIRLQCRLELPALSALGRLPLEKRVRSLLRKNAKRWAGPVQELAIRWEYRRGFVETIQIQTEGRRDNFVETLQECQRAAPVRGLMLGEQFFDGRALLTASPYLSGLREFLVWNGHLHSEGRHLRDLFSSTQFAGLRRLEMFGPRDGSWFRTSVLTALLRAPSLAGLEELALEDYLEDLDPAILRAIARAPFARGLRRLSLFGSRVEAAEMRRLGRSLLGLHVLELRHGKLDHAAWTELLAHAAFPSLRRLLLGGASVDRESVASDSAAPLRNEAHARYGETALDVSQEWNLERTFHTRWDR